MSNAIPTKAGKYAEWLANFNTNAATYQATLGLSQQDLTTLNNSATSVNSGIAGAVSAAAASKAAHQTKTTNLANSGKLVRVYAHRIEANPAVSDTIKKQLGLPVRVPKTHTPPTVPTMLVAVGQDNGTNLLSWENNGNIAGTMYLIERQCGTETGWTMVSSTTSRKFADSGCTPGVKTSYRVRAKRRTETSDPSNVAVLYGA